MPEKERNAAPNTEVGKQTKLEQWREEARRAREPATEKNQDPERTRDHSKDKDRDGPGYER